MAMVLNLLIICKIFDHTGAVEAVSRGESKELYLSPTLFILYMGMYAESMMKNP